MTLTIRLEPDIDFDETARLANDAFGASGFSRARLEWLYTRAFSGPTVVLGLFDDGRKVGQVVLVGQQARIGGDTAAAAGLVDLFILKASRSRAAIALLYEAVERHCRECGLRFLLAVPNGKAAGVNQRFLGMRNAFKLDIRMGIAAPVAGPVAVSSAVAGLSRREGEALFGRYVPGAGNGVAWTAASLWARLQNPLATYGVHATSDLLLVSSSRVLRRVPHTLLCAFFAREGTTATRRDVRAVTAAACRLHRRPIFIYTGLNGAIPLPGLSLPERLRPSPMVVQVRDFAAPADEARFDRFELIDFDFA